MSPSWVVGSRASPRLESSAVAAGVCSSSKHVTGWGDGHGSRRSPASMSRWVAPSSIGPSLTSGRRSPDTVWASSSSPKPTAHFLRRDDGIEELAEKAIHRPQRRRRAALSRGPRPTSPNRCRSPKVRPPSEADLRLHRRAHRRPRPRSKEPGPPGRALRRAELGAERPRGLPGHRQDVRPRRFRRADGPGYEWPMGARGRNRLAGRRDAPRSARGCAPQARWSR